MPSVADRRRATASAHLQNVPTARPALGPPWSSNATPAAKCPCRGRSLDGSTILVHRVVHELLPTDVDRAQFGATRPSHPGVALPSTGRRAHDGSRRLWTGPRPWTIKYDVSKKQVCLYREPS